MRSTSTWKGLVATTSKLVPPFGLIQYPSVPSAEHYRSEALKGANPVGANSPQVPPYKLVTERISGTAFTAPRAENLQTFIYRVKHSTSHGELSPYPSSSPSSETQTLHLTPNPILWMNFPIKGDGDWISSRHLLAESGSPSKKTGLNYQIYEISKSMAPDTTFSSSDGDYLIVPQSGTLDIQTELGMLLVRQNEIAVIPRGIKYRVEVPNGVSRGYICELYQGHFRLPELGPIGSCSLANVRDFQIPTAYFEGRVENGVATCGKEEKEWTIVTKFAGKLYSGKQNHTPFDVAAWHGTFLPYKYDLGRFSVIGSILYDHPDPSIFTVLTVPSFREPGHSVVDFAIISPRWLVMEDTYWPPYGHRNTMAEFSGMIINSQDPEAVWNKRKDGFKPIGAQLNNAMVPHGVNRARHEEARTRELKPEKVGMEGFTIFLFESEAMMGITDWGMEAAGKLPKVKL